MDGKDSLSTTLSDKEGLFLKGLLSHHEEERKQAAQQYQQWLQREFLNTNGALQETKVCVTDPKLFSKKTDISNLENK